MRRLKLLIGLTISGALFFYLLRSIDMDELLTQVRHIRWSWALLSMALAVVGLWTRAARWRYLFPPRSAPPGLQSATMIGYMANNVLPLRAGEVVRIYVVARRWARSGRRLADAFWTALATLVVERVLDSLAIVCVLAVLVLLVPVPAIFQWTAGVLLLIDVGAVAALIVFARAPDQARRLIERLTRRWPRLERRALRIVDTFGQGLDGIRTGSHLLPLAIWTVVVWAVPALAAWTMLRAVNLDLPLLAGWTVLAFVGLSVSVPSAPGYVGVFHYAAALAVGMFGVAPSERIGYALVFHAGQIVPVTLAGWIALLREDMSLSEAVRARAGVDTPAPQA